MLNLAIIPARGGSKRIPRKNIKDFLGKPIIAYSIETALKSKLFDEVMVSTDDDQIAAIAKENGAKVPFLRSNENASDHATTMDVIKEVLRKYSETENRHFDYACCLYPTAPLIQIEKLKEGYKLLICKEYDTVIPVVPFSYPVWRGLSIDDQNNTKMIWPENLNARSQDLKTVYHDAGQWYWLNAKQVPISLFPENMGSIVLYEHEVQDVDSIIDWKMAEMKYKLINMGEKYEEI